MLRLGLGGVVCAASGFMAYAVRGRCSAVFAPSVYRGSRTRRSLALTFDDGPSEGTVELLRILNRYGVPATFFVCGGNVTRLPDIARAIVAEGHEVGNHTYSHAPLYLRSAAFIGGEVEKAQSVISEVTGKAPALFRAPFGARWFGLREVQRRHRLLGVMWTVIGRDWKLSAEAITRRVVRGSDSGGIICLHDGRGVAPNPDIAETLESVRRIIPALQSRGYAFETVSKLLCPNN